MLSPPKRDIHIQSPHNVNLDTNQTLFRSLPCNDHSIDRGLSPCQPLSSHDSARIPSIIYASNSHPTFPNIDSEFQANKRMPNAIECHRPERALRVHVDYCNDSSMTPIQTQHYRSEMERPNHTRKHPYHCCCIHVPRIYKKRMAMRNADEQNKLYCYARHVFEHDYDYELESSISRRVLSPIPAFNPVSFRENACFDHVSPMFGSPIHLSHHTDHTDPLPICCSSYPDSLHIPTVSNPRSMTPRPRSIPRLPVPVTSTVQLPPLIAHLRSLSPTLSTYPLFLDTTKAAQRTVTLNKLPSLPPFWELEAGLTRTTICQKPSTTTASNKCPADFQLWELESWPTAMASRRESSTTTTTVDDSPCLDKNWNPPLFTNPFAPVPRVLQPNEGVWDGFTFITGVTTAT